ncbi:DMT family transporter [Pseudoprimorskyibacter insulae]|nr:DMT family transporter [Pseudoprimorskyibacter insulae]
MAVGYGYIDSVDFATIRLLSGALFLFAVFCLRNGCIKVLVPQRPLAVIALVTYMLGFSVAYQGIDAGIGALVLFGCVNLTMFLGSIQRGARPSAIRWITSATAFGGLVWLLWPAGNVPISATSVAFMIMAGVGWGLYSLAGQGLNNPVQNTAANFMLAVPICIVLGLFFPHGIQHFTPHWPGVALAVLSGTVMSGLGYSLWYAILPRLSATSAGLAQLSVPVFAILGGALLLGETVTARIFIASLIVLGSIGVSFLLETPNAQSVPTDRSKSRL